MKRAAAIAAVLAWTAVSGARADATLLATTASCLGANTAANLVRTPYAGLGVFATWWESKDYGDLAGYGLRFGWNIFGPLGLEARASYLETDDDHAKTSLVPLEGALTWRLRLGKKLDPYLGAGIGYYMKNAEYDNSATWNDAEKVAGYFALAGLNLALGPLALFAEAKYNLVGTDDELRWRGSDVEAKNSLDGLSLEAGVKLGF